MAIVQRMSSDLTGVEDEPEKFCSLIVRSGPGIDRPLAFDALPQEIGNIDAAKDIYVVEIREHGQVNGTEIVCTLKELNSKVVPEGKTLEQLLESARSLRGRRPGSRNGTA